MNTRKSFLITAILLIYFASLPLITHGLGVSLMRLKTPKVRVSVPPGGSTSEEIEIENPAGEEMAIRVYVEDWVYSSQDGAKNFSAPGTTETSCSNWITFSPKDFSLPPYGKRIIHITVNVPEDAIGANYSVIFFETLLSPASKDPGTASVNLMGRLGTLIYVQSEGTIEKKVDFFNLKIARKKDEPGYQITGDIANRGNCNSNIDGTFNIIDNEGNVFARGAFNTAYTLQGDKAVMTAGWDENLPKGEYFIVVSLDAGGTPIIGELTVEIDDKGTIAKSEIL